MATITFKFRLKGVDYMDPLSLDISIDTTVFSLYDTSSDLVTRSLDEEDSAKLVSDETGIIKITRPKVMANRLNTATNSSTSFMGANLIDNTDVKGKIMTQMQQFFLFTWPRYYS